MKKTTRMTSRIFIPFLIISALWGCYPDYGLGISDFDLVVTQYDAEFNFADTSKKYYVLDDTVRYITDDDDPDHKYDTQLKSEIRAKLLELGYEEIALDTLNLPDFYVTIALTNKDVYTYYYGGYYPGWGGGWGWYYPPYWGGYVGYSYSTGTVITTMGDVENLDDSDPENVKMPIAWSSTFNGITNDTEANVRARITRAIDQAFEQSPFLKRN